MRRLRFVRTVIILLLLAFFVFDGLLGHAWLAVVNDQFVMLLPASFRTAAYFAMYAAIPLGALLFVIYIRHSSRAVIAGAREAGKLCAIANELLDKGEYESAVSALTAAIRNCPEFAPAFINRGCAYFHLGKLDEALADLDTAISLDSRSAQAYGWRGNTWAKRQDWDKALANYDAAQRLDPKDPAILIQRGKVWLKKSDSSRALADFDRAVAIAPDYEIGLRTRGEYWTLEKKQDRAIADFTEAIRLSPSRSDSYRNRGLCWFRKGEYERGLADLEEALRINPTDAVALSIRGACQLKQGEFAAAKLDFQEAIRLRPKYPDPYKNLAWLAATCPDSAFRNGAQAVEWAKTAMQLAGKEVAEWFTIMAAAYAEAGIFNEAIHWQTRHRDLCLKSRADSQVRLELYQSGQAYREPPSSESRSGPKGELQNFPGKVANDTGEPE